MVFRMVSFVTACIAIRQTCRVCQCILRGNTGLTFDVQFPITAHLGFRLTDKTSLAELRK